MREFYNFLSSLPPRAYTLVAVLLGMILIDDLTPEEQGALGSFFGLIGQTMWINAAQTELLISRMKTNEIDKMKKDIEELKRRFY